MKQFFFLLLLTVLVNGQSTPHVHVDIWGEAMCDDTADLIKGALNQTLATEGIWDIVDLHVTPWGNAYCETEVCKSPTPGQYNATIRICWNSECNVTGSSVPKDCFSCIPEMKQTCQHGHDECIGNRVVGCVNEAFGHKHREPWYFVSCFQGLHIGDLAFAKGCAEEVDLNYTEITHCTKDNRGIRVDEENARHTTTQPHPGTPTVFIDRKEVTDQSKDGLITAICSAYKGDHPPPACTKSL